MFARVGVQKYLCEYARVSELVRSSRRTCKYPWVHVCACVCLCVGRRFACMHVYVGVYHVWYAYDMQCVYMQLCANRLACMHTYMYTLRSPRVRHSRFAPMFPLLHKCHAHMCISTSLSLSLYIYIYIHMYYLSIHIYAYTHRYIYIYIYIYIHICARVCKHPRVYAYTGTHVVQPHVSIITCVAYIMC